MIKREDKEFLYNQLKEIEKISKQGEKVISENKFYSITDAELIKYVFRYRDRQIISYPGKRVKAYLELPDMDLSGQDLSGVELLRFVPGIISNGEITKSAINLRDTNAIINISTIFHNEEQIHENYNEYITDLSMCDFRGCNLYGRTQEEQKQFSARSKARYTFIGQEKLDERYLKRRKLHEQTPEKKRRSDEIYSRLLSGLSLDFSLARKESVDLTDYDFSSLSKWQIENIFKNIASRKINMGYTGIIPGKLGAETFYTLIQSTNDATQIGDIQFIKKYLGYMRSIQERVIAENNGRKNGALDSGIKKATNYLYRFSPESVPEEYWEDLTPENLNNAVHRAYRKGEYDCVIRFANSISETTAKQIISSLARESKSEFLGSFLRTLNGIQLSPEMLTTIYTNHGIDIIPRKMLTNKFLKKTIESEYEKKNMEAVNKLLSLTGENSPQPILAREYELGNYQIVRQNFSRVPDPLKREIMRTEYKRGNLNFVLENLRALNNQDITKFWLEVYRANPSDARTLIRPIRHKSRAKIISQVADMGEIGFVATIWGDLSSSERNKVAELQKNKENVNFLHILELKIAQDRKDGKMILVEEERKAGDLLKVFETENGISFSDSKILPIEQREILLGLFGKSTSSKVVTGESELERKQRERIVEEIIKRLQDKRLKKPAKIKTMYSEGGSQTATNSRDKAELESKSARVKYLVIEINGVVILEPFGQKNNATFVAQKSKDMEQRIINFGRKSALSNGFYKVVHNGSSTGNYNYESNHILKLLDMAIEDKEGLFRILKGVKANKKYCNLDTLEAKYTAMKLAKEYGLSKDEVLSAERAPIVKEGEDKDEK